MTQLTYQLLKLTATILNASMTSTYKILPHPGMFLIIWQADTILVTNFMSVSTRVQIQETLDIPIENNEWDSGQVTSQDME